MYKFVLFYVKASDGVMNAKEIVNASNVSIKVDYVDMKVN